jgi:ABC-type phosphate transport system ATPase subunit
LLSNKSARLSLGLKDSEALMISFPDRTGSLSDNDGYQLKILGELLGHDPTETIFAQPNDPRTRAYIEGAFG